MKHIYLLLIFIITAGCGGNLSLHGRVTFSDNGEPLTVGTVVFVAGGLQARGDIDANGHYNMGFVRSDDGLPPGEYRIYISAYLNAGDEDVPLVANKYLQAETSGLTLKVDSKTKVFDIQVERPEK